MPPVQPSQQPVYNAENSPVPVQTATFSSAPAESDKSYLVAFLLSYLLGGWGIDRFYLGRVGSGIAKLLTLGGLGIWTVVDQFLLAFDKLRDKENRQLTGYAIHAKWTKIFIIITTVLGFFAIPALILLIVFLAVPALQSNARDTARKNDLANIGSSLSAYSSDHTGSYPSDDAFPAFLSSVSGLTVLMPSDVSYSATPSGCDDVHVSCTGYKLSTQSESGKELTSTN